jgi:hypothetical protein
MTDLKMSELAGDEDGKEAHNIIAVTPIEKAAKKAPCPKKALSRGKLTDAGSSAP